MNNARAQLIAKIGGGAVTIAISLITAYEGYSPRVVADPIGRLQVCYGHDDQTMTRGAAYSQEQCAMLLDQDMKIHSAVVDCVKPEILQTLTPGQKGVLVSLAYNNGNAKICESTLVKKFNAGEGRAACEEISKWVYAGGKNCTIRANGCYGIAKRRAIERRICEL